MTPDVLIWFKGHGGDVTLELLSACDTTCHVVASSEIGIPLHD